MLIIQVALHVANLHYIIARVHNIYNWRECPTLHMPYTNTLRKVMIQVPLTNKGVNNLKAIYGT